MEQEILQAIVEHDKIICLRHISPDGDAYGSAYGLGQVIRDNFPAKKVLFGGKGENYLNFLTQPDIIAPEEYTDALVIVTDTPVISRIDGQGWEKAKMIIKIDHHPFMEKFGTIEWIEEHRISASEMVGQLVLQSDWIISSAAAQLILTGIITDSNRFLYSQTSSQTLAIASQLINFGGQLSIIYQNIYEDNVSFFNFKNHLKSLINYNNGIAYVQVSNRLLKRRNISYEMAKSLVNIMAGVKEFEIWVYFIENKLENYINVSIRSKRIAINKVAEKYHGGGHKLASGCKIKNWSQVNEVLNDLAQLLK